MRNSSMGPPLRIDPTTHRTMSERSYQGATSRSLHVSKLMGYSQFYNLKKNNYVSNQHRNPY